MAHYICTGECQGVVMQPGTCQSPDCSRKGQSLFECDCTDGAHSDVKSGDVSEQNRDSAPNESTSA